MIVADPVVVIVLLLIGAIASALIFRWIHDGRPLPVFARYLEPDAKRCVSDLVQIAYDPARTQKDLRAALELAFLAWSTQGSLRVLDQIIDHKEIKLGNRPVAYVHERLVYAVRDAAISVDVEVARLYEVMGKNRQALTDLHPGLQAVFSAATRRRIWA